MGYIPENDTELTKIIDYLLDFSKKASLKARYLKWGMFSVVFTAYVKVLVEYYFIFDIKLFTIAAAIFAVLLFLAIWSIKVNYFYFISDSKYIKRYIKLNLFNHIIQSIHSQIIYRPMFRRDLLYFSTSQLFKKTVTEVFEDDCLDLRTSNSHAYISDCRVLHKMEEMFRGIYISIKFQNTITATKEFTDALKIEEIVKSYFEKNNIEMEYSVNKLSQFVFIAISTPHKNLEVDYKKVDSIRPEVYLQANLINQVISLVTNIEEEVCNLANSYIPTQNETTESLFKETVEYTVFSPGSIGLKALSFLTIFVGFGFICSGNVYAILLGLFVISLCLMVGFYCKHTIYNFTNHSAVITKSYFFYKRKSSFTIFPQYSLLVNDRSRRISANQVTYVCDIHLQDAQKNIYFLKTFRNKREKEVELNELGRTIGDNLVSVNSI